MTTMFGNDGRYWVELMEVRVKGSRWEKGYDEEPDYEEVVADIQSWWATQLVGSLPYTCLLTYMPE